MPDARAVQSICNPPHLIHHFLKVCLCITLGPWKAGGGSQVGSVHALYTKYLEKRQSKEIAEVLKRALGIGRHSFIETQLSLFAHKFFCLYVPLQVLVSVVPLD